MVTNQIWEFLKNILCPRTSPKILKNHDFSQKSQFWAPRCSKVHRDTPLKERTHPYLPMGQFSEFLKMSLCPRKAVECMEARDQRVTGLRRSTLHDSWRRSLQLYNSMTTQLQRLWFSLTDTFIFKVCCECAIIVSTAP